MEYTKVLAWHTNDGIKYYDISTEELLRGAALRILEERLEIGMFSKPRPPNKDVIYQRNRQRLFNLEIVVGDSKDDTFEDMHQQIKDLRRFNAIKEESYRQGVEEWDSIIRTIKEQDGVMATMIITNRVKNYGEQIELIEIPKYVHKTTEKEKESVEY